ncbi:MAG TPA: hypothetical protein VIV65_08255 [Gemmatimonadaceae bacterium]|jgi:hypothetical protein
MAQFSVREYDQLERAIRDGQRVAVMRRGTEYIIVPLAIRVRAGRDLIEARNPTTGDAMTLFIDDLDSFAVLS